MTPDFSEVMTPGQVAEAFGVTLATVSDFANTGKLDYIRHTSRGRRLFSAAQVRQMTGNQDLPGRPYTPPRVYVTDAEEAPAPAPTVPRPRWLFCQHCDEAIEGYGGVWFERGHSSVCYHSPDTQHRPDGDEVPQRREVVVPRAVKARKAVKAARYVVAASSRFVLPPEVIARCADTTCTHGVS